PAGAQLSRAGDRPTGDLRLHHRMAKKRVHEIAKEQGITSKEALAALKKAGLEVTTASSSEDEADAAQAKGDGDAAQAKGDGAKTKAGGKQQAPRREIQRPPTPEGEVKRAGPEG